MSAPFIIPFNFQPVSVSVQTGSYVIPAGKYARVVVNIEGTGTFTINGVTAMTSYQNQVITAGNNLFRIAGTPTTTNNQQPGSLLDGAQSSNAATSVAPVTVYGSDTDKKVASEYYFLPSGTTINGTGTWRAVVEIYNEIT